VGYCVLVLAGAYFAAGLAANELGLSGSNARYIRVISIAAVLFIGLMVLVIIIPVWTWYFFRNDPEVAWCGIWARDSSTPGRKPANDLRS
jgi:hypothetical protein